MNKIVIQFLYSLLIASLAKPFIATTTFNNYHIMFAALFIASFINLSKIPKISKVSISLMIGFILLFAYTHNDQYTFSTWLPFIIDDLSFKMSSFLSRNLSLIPQEIGLLITFYLICIGTILIPHRKSLWKIWLVSYILFYLLLSAFIKIQFREASLITISVALIVSLAESYYSNTLKNKKAIIIVLTSISIFSFIAFDYNTYYSSIHTTLIEKSIDLRSNLSSRNFYEHFNLSNKNSTSSRSGFSNNDERLGGPLYMDYSPVFKVKEDKPTYWRAGTKYIYTGYGWKESELQYTETSNSFPEIIGQETLNPDIKNSHTILESSDEMTFIPIPLGQSEISNIPNISYSITSNTFINKYSIDSILFEKPNKNTLSNLTFQTHPPLTDKEVLENVGISESSKDILKEFNTHNIPNSVKRLALQITEKGESIIEKVKLLETYLKSSNDLKYSLSDVPYVPTGMDYVEHFLFSSKIGYCEHFASAFVTMAQSIGIPTRYAKGFAKGSHSQGITTIHNSDAHAWPEVYFEEYGWIPFEPTPSFNLETVTTADSNPELPPIDSDQIPASRDPKENDSIVVNPSTTQEIKHTKDSNSKDQLLFGVFITGLVLVSLVLKYRLYLRRHLVMYSLKRSQLNFKEAFLKTIHFIEYIHPRSESTLISEYIEALPNQIKNALKLSYERFQDINYGMASNMPLTLSERENLLNVLKTIKINGK